MTVSKEGHQFIGGTSELGFIAVLSFPTFNHLPRCPAPLNFGMPSACARLRARHSCQNGEPSPSTSENKHRRKQNEYFKETDWAHGIAVGPECNPGDGADL